MNKKRLFLAFVIFSVVMVLLCVRVGYLQIVKGEELRKKAVSQQTKDEIVEAKRGDITDRNGNNLAVSTLRYSVWVSPATVMSEGDTPEEKQTKRS